MNFTEKQEKGQELLQELVTKAWESKKFKEQLISNPKTTIEQVTGNSASDVKYVVEDQTDPSKIFFNIPSKPNLDNLELTDAQLELVAGGYDEDGGLFYQIGYHSMMMNLTLASAAYHAIFD